MKVLLIIPAYNEEENILRTIASIETFKQEVTHFQHELDYVVINDGSTDGTKQILEANQINSIHLVFNLGIGGAVQTGYKYALENEYDVAVQFDGDGQHDINSLPILLEPLAEGKCDFSIGSRFIPGNEAAFQSTKMRRFGIRLLSFCIRMASGKTIYDVTSGYRAGNRKVIAFFAKRYPTNYPEPESIVHLIKKRFVIVERPVNMMERLGGVSSIRALASVKYMLEVGSAILIAAFMKEGD